MRSRRVQLAAAAMLVAVLAGEVAGRWLVTHVPFASDAPGRTHSGLDAWPALVVAAKVGLALVLAQLTWRLVRTRGVVRAGEGMLQISRFHGIRPRPEIGLSPRAWLVSFVAMSLLYVVPTSTGELTSGCWPLVTPWLHTQALPVFAVLAVLLAVIWRTVSRWLTALERYAQRLGQLVRLARPRLYCGYSGSPTALTPRALFGVAFESRPPPVTA